MIKGLLHEFNYLWRDSVVSGKQLRGLLGVFTIIPAIVVGLNWLLYGVNLSLTNRILLDIIILTLIFYPFKKLFTFIYKCWMSFAVLLGFIISNIFLSLFFYIILTPVGTFMRLFGKDPLKKGFRTKEETYWQESLKKNYKKQF